MKLLSDPEKLKFMEIIKGKNVMIAEKERLLGEKNAEIKSLKRRLDALNYQMSALRSGEMNEKLTRTEALLQLANERLRKRTREAAMGASVRGDCQRCTRAYPQRMAVLDKIKKEFDAKQERLGLKDRFNA